MSAHLTDRVCSTLIILSILEKFDLKKMTKGDYTHIFCESTKIAYFLRDQYLADPKLNKLSIDYFLNSKLIDQYASSIDINEAKIYNLSDFPDHPDTIYLTVRDKNGMVISFINSLFDAFGSGITAPKVEFCFIVEGELLIQFQVIQMNLTQRKDLCTP